MSDLNNANHFFQSSIGGKNYNYSLPNQVLPKSKKTDAWKERTMDRLEEIAIYQLSKNLAFKDYYDMFNGNLVLRDFDETLPIANNIANMTERVAGLPSYLKHFDIIGVIVNLLAGEYDNQKDKLVVTSVDEYSRAELLREKSVQIRNYTEQYFKLELKRLLLLRGVNVDKQDFKSDEERQAYIQNLEQEKSKLTKPSQIEENTKSFQSKIVEWAEAVLESDYLDHNLHDLDQEEFIDYLLTGRYFRHYHIGYDYYKPERWNPIQTFFSEDLEIVYPQNGEYVGYTHFMSPSDFLSRYGEKIPLKFAKGLQDEYVDSPRNEVSMQGFLRKGFSKNHIVPYEGFYRRDLANRFQSATGIPMGDEYRQNENGDIVSKPAFLYDNNYNYVGARYAPLLRDDVDVRLDSLQITEGYWRGSKLMGLLTIPNPFTEEPYQVEVEEDLLKEYISDKEIKQLRTISLEEAKEKKELNTIAWFPVPQVWKGKKLNGGNNNILKDFYFDIEPLPFQIRGDSNLFDVKLPVAGIITNPISKKLRTYQVEHNLHMNLIRSATEKHIGEFMLIDFNLLAAQYKHEWGEDTVELVNNFTQNIKDVSMAFTDMSPGNTQSMNPNASVPQKLSINTLQDMQYHMQMAEFFRNEAFKLIGITPQRLGQPDKYSTAEGIRQGVDASYAQTERYYRRFNTAKKEEAKIHLRVAQFCVKDNKDITFDYLKPDVGRVIIKFTDEDFWLRKIGVKLSNDPEKRKKLENFRNMMMQNNTANNDLLDFAKIMTSSSFQTLIEYAEQSRMRIDQAQQAKLQSDQQIVQQQIEANKEMEAIKHQRAIEIEQIKNTGDIRVAEINGLARAADNNADMELIKEIRTTANENIRNEQTERKLDIQEKDVERKSQIDQNAFQQALKREALELEKLKVRREEMRAKKFTSIINKN